MWYMTFHSVSSEDDEQARRVQRSGIAAGLLNTFRSPINMERSHFYTTSNARDLYDLKLLQTKFTSRARQLVHKSKSPATKQLYIYIYNFVNIWHDLDSCYKFSIF
jgi:hypothetical protein